MASPPLADSRLLLFVREKWKAAAAIFIAYVALTWLSGQFLPHPDTLFPASAVALAGLFFEGLGFWITVYAAALIGGIIVGYPPIFLAVMPFAQALQAAAGAFLLRKTGVDPIFRRFRDVFLLFLIAAAVSLIVPIAGSLGAIFASTVFGMTYPLAAFSLRYIGTIFCLITITPFLMRWLAKRRFRRSAKEIAETLAVFAALIALEYLAFIGGLGAVEDIPLAYFMLVPLFWIALRLRPRFITLAILITSGFAIAGLYIGASPASPDLFPLRLFQTEEFLIALAAIFFIVASLEEERRVNANLLRSQVATLENAVLRISSESSAKNDFIAMLAHELRNPLAPIASSIELMALRTDRDEEDAGLLGVMQERMQAVRRLLDDLLDISRITEGKVALRKEYVDVGTCIRRAIASTTHHLVERHQSLEFELPEAPLYIMGDPLRIEQIFSNLITNASKYSKDGDEIAVRVQKNGGRAEVRVEDEGTGIKEKDLENVFIPFHQLSLDGRDKKGLGIGLGLVRSFVDLHEGTVRAESGGLGKGSVFIVSLPLAEGQPPAVPKADDAPTRPPTRGMPLVLIVDDNDAAAGSMGKLLELKGCSVAYAYDGRHAVEKAESLSPDVILLDIGLPDYDGYTVAKMIRAQGYQGRLIALTGFSTEDARAKGANSGFDHYLVKPTGLAELKRVIPEIG